MGELGFKPKIWLQRPYRSNLLTCRNTFTSCTCKYTDTHYSSTSTCIHNSYIDTLRYSQPQTCTYAWMCLQTLQHRYTCHRKDYIDIHTHTHNHTHPDTPTLSNRKDPATPPTYYPDKPTLMYRYTHILRYTHHPNTPKTLIHTNQIFSPIQIHSYSNTLHRFTYSLYLSNAPR